MLSAINHPNRSRRERIERVRQRLVAIRDSIPGPAVGLRSQYGIDPYETAELRRKIEGCINDLDLLV